MDPRLNPYARGAGSSPAEFAGRDELAERAAIALGRVRRNIASLHRAGYANIHFSYEAGSMEIHPKLLSSIKFVHSTISHNSGDSELNSPPLNRYNDNCLDMPYLTEALI